jgi:predicted 3-demethylubiquinone-9 3-methyltransferase (glyoxalase superfamily)
VDETISEEPSPREKIFTAMSGAGLFRRPKEAHLRGAGPVKVTQHLWFEQDMEAAISFYTSLIAGSAIDWITTIPAETPSGPAGSVKIASFTLGDQRYMAIEAGPLDPFNHSFSIMVECDTQAEIDRLWDALKAGGSTEQCGWLRDRWGSPGRLHPSDLAS